MKKIAFILALIASLTSFAQDNALTMNAPKPKSNGQKGFYVGMDYMNLTDLQIQMESNTQYGTHRDTQEGGTHIGFVGIMLGYNQTPERGIGFNAGARLLDKLNRNETVEGDFRMVIPEVNLTLAANRYLTAYAGLNVAIWTGQATLDKYTPTGGGQAGLGVRFTKNIAFNAGYTIMTQQMKETNGNDKMKADVRASGFASNLTYTF